MRCMRILDYNIINLPDTIHIKLIHQEHALAWHERAHCIESLY